WRWRREHPRPAPGHQLLGRMPLNLEDRMDTFKATAVLACVLGTPIATADIYQYEDCDGNGTLLLTELDAEPHVNLSYMYLGCANLPQANLLGAHLSWADLSYADLTGAFLYDADLSFSNLILGKPDWREPV
ncbi:MAG: pentapeptide repeat-containing protein, partial [Phycisphaerales bacterium]|nr:pentapeptide repeat-containing protein [Phycisphaerales bacterium]